MSEQGVALASLGILGTAVGSLIWLIKNLFNQNTVTLIKLSDSIDKSAKASDKLTSTLAKNEEKNRQFQQQVLNSFEHQNVILESINHNTVEVLRHVSTPTVETQIVKKQIVTNEEK